MPKSIEVRINSVQDAKSAVTQSAKICNFAKELECESIQLLIDESVKSEVMPLVAGAFGKKTIYSTIKPQKDNVLFQLPHYVASKLPVKELVIDPAKRGPGRPARQAAAQA